MKTTRSLPATPVLVARPVLRWVFRRNHEAITCEVDVNASGTCEVRTVPEWNPALAVVEGFDRAGDALQRHAEVAARLRELGWGAADHVPVAA
jgi:hypothetical protein